MAPIRVLHVNNIDIRGRGFNGYDLIGALDSRGVECKQAVVIKLSKNPSVVALAPGPADEELQRRIAAAEKLRSMNDLLYPWGRALARTQEFRDADVVHYHLVHNQLISLLDLPWLFGIKPSVWTFHDPWAMTGHCVHPIQCDLWLTGCEHCPVLGAHFPLKEDCAARVWKIKQRVLAQSDVDIVVASEWMMDLVRASPLTAGLERVHVIPFGTDTETYPSDDEKALSREALGIPPDDFVVMFRAATEGLKGMRFLSWALAQCPPERPTTLLTIGMQGQVDRLAGAYNIVELGWVDDVTTMHRAYSACDVFVMPSLAESFGLMAVEAMAAGRPVVCFEDTAVASTTHAPDCGLAVPPGDSRALRTALDTLMRDPDQAVRRGELGRSYAAEHYGRDRYLDSLASLYRDVAGRGRPAPARERAVPAAMLKRLSDEDLLPSAWRERA